MKSLHKYVNYFFFMDDELVDSTAPGGSSPARNESLFESIKHIDEDGNEFWYARELQKALEYTEWRNFYKVIEKAITACNESGNNLSNHLVDVNEMVIIGSGAQRDFPSYKLSRYACYLIVMNGDPRKEIIALGQTYFAVKTRQQELTKDFEELTEDQKRLDIRGELKNHNKSLADTAHNAGVTTTHDYAIFQNHGYKGLYGGLGAKDIHAKKGLKKSQQILDHMGSTELAANLFRATQTEEKLIRESIQGKSNANEVHYSVGKEVRDTIERLGGTMPENLPTPSTSISQLEAKRKKLPK